MSKQQQDRMGKGASDLNGHAAEYQSVRSDYEQFTTKLSSLLRDLLAENMIEFHLLESRTKTVESFGEKIGRATKSYSSPLQEMTDLSGIRIITYYQDDADRIGKVIEDEFSVDQDASVTHQAGPSEFGYRSAHYVVSTSGARRSLLEWKRFASLKAEIQVRTVLQHAWAAISHKLQYKREEDVPVALRRKLFRLSALFELSDDEFVAIRDASGIIAADVDARISSGDGAIAIDYISVGRFLEQSPLIDELVSAAVDAGFLKSDDPEDLSMISEMVSIAWIGNLEKLEDLSNVLRQSMEWAPQFFRELFATEKSGYWEVTPAFVCLLVLIAAFSKRVTRENLIESDWGEETADQVLQVALTYGR